MFQSKKHNTPVQSHPVPQEHLIGKDGGLRGRVVQRALAGGRRQENVRVAHRVAESDRLSRGARVECAHGDARQQRRLKLLRRHVREVHRAILHAANSIQFEFIS